MQPSGPIRAQDRTPRLSDSSHPRGHRHSRLSRRLSYSIRQIIELQNCIVQESRRSPPSAPQLAHLRAENGGVQGDAATAFLEREGAQSRARRNRRSDAGCRRTRGRADVQSCTDGVCAKVSVSKALRKVIKGDFAAANRIMQCDIVMTGAIKIRGSLVHNQLTRSTGRAYTIVLPIRGTLKDPQ